MANRVLWWKQEPFYLLTIDDFLKYGHTLAGHILFSYMYYRRSWSFYTAAKTSNTYSFHIVIPYNLISNTFHPYLEHWRALCHVSCWQWKCVISEDRVGNNPCSYFYSHIYGITPLFFSCLPDIWGLPNKNGVNAMAGKQSTDGAHLLSSQPEPRVDRECTARCTEWE